MKLAALLLVLITLISCQTNNISPTNHHFEYNENREYEKCYAVMPCMVLLRDIISANWLYPDDAESTITVIVQVGLNENAEISEMVIVESSGESRFDQSVLLAISKSQPFTELLGLYPEVLERHFSKFKFKFAKPAT